MRRRKTRQVLLAAIGATALAGLGVGLGIGPSGGLAAQAATRHLGDLPSNAPVAVVASGLNEPRNLTWGPDGHLLVAEDGVPPTTCVNDQCFGLNGTIADISSGTPVRIVTGLATYEDTGEIVGPSGILYAHGHLYALTTHTPLPFVPPGLPPALTAQLTEQYGALMDVTDGNIRVIANPGDVFYEWANEHKSLAPHDFPDSNPYDLIPKPGGGFYVIDAAADALGSVDRWGRTRVLAFIPNTPAGSDSVPTCLAMGPGGDVYIGQLTGHGNTGTAANVYRYDPRDGSLTVWQSGFSAIDGCGFGANGDFYVTELDTGGVPPTNGGTGGAVIQISHDGTRTVLGAGQLLAPAGFLAGPDGSIYVSNHVVFTATGPTPGEVVKIG